MPFLPGLAVVFVGALGGGHPKLHQQVNAIVKDLHGSAKALPATSVAALTRPTSATKSIVKQLHAQGVVGFELAGENLRVATYDSQGVQKSYLELSLANGALGREDLKTLEDSISDDFSLGHAKAAAPATAPAAVQTADASVGSSDSAGPSDGDAAPGLGGEVHATPSSSSSSGSSSIRAGASLGLGVIARSFEPPSASGIIKYNSSPVGLISGDGYVAPTANLRVHLFGESTLSMSTDMGGGMSASTAIARWEATVGYAVTHGTVELAPVVGYGHRSFSIDTTSMIRSPDGNYDYLILGATAGIPLGGRFTLRGNVLFQPCVGGDQSTAMTLGDASRYALDLGASVEMRFTHVFARAGLDWQHFSWTWDAAATAEAGGAVDTYTAGTVAVGADY